MEKGEATKAKGDELIEKFMELPISYLSAIKSSIIAVEEIIKENQSVYDMLKVHGNGRNRLVVLDRIANLTEVLNYLKSKL